MQELEPRRDYARDSLRRAQLDADPFRQFEHWLGEARAAGLIDATAMSLATVDPDGQPHCRIVLLKAVDTRGFTFYTNRQSDKGVQLTGNARAALLFYWRDLERQVRISGHTEHVDDAAADDYFATRPEGSRFGSAASPQSRVVKDRDELEAMIATLRERYPNGDVPRPAHWGGYRLLPERIEFWQGRADRVHDRFLYRRQANADWSINRLAP